MFFDLTPHCIPEQPLTPPEPAYRAGDWFALFRCVIGDEGLKVKVHCDVTCNDEIDPDTVQIFLEPSTTGYLHDIEISGVLNDGLRADIKRHFDANFHEIYAYNHE